MLLNAAAAFVIGFPSPVAPISLYDLSGLKLNEVATGPFLMIWVWLYICHPFSMFALMVTMAESEECRDTDVSHLMGSCTCEYAKTENRIIIDVRIAFMIFLLKRRNFWFRL
jgi:hypothetical protein